MIKYLLQCLFVVFLITNTTAQTTYTVQPDGTTGIDAWVLSEYTPNNDTNTNYGTDARLDAWRWTNTGVPYSTRAYLKFDVSSLPTTAVVCSAILTVHTDGNNEMSGSNQPNAFYLKRATSSWTQSGIKWDNQPTLSTTNIISVGSYTSTTTGTSYTIDVSSHIQDMITNPSTNYGWAIMLQNESNTYAALGLASSNHATAAYRPMLTVVYVPSLTVTATSTTLCAGGSSTLTVSGASTYSWTPPSSGLSASTGTSVVATPTASTTYTVTGTTGSCSTSKATVAITVNPLPTLTVSPSSPSICIGSNITFTASGASTYSWTPPTTLSCSVCASPTANPTVTTNYTVTGTNSNGCINTKAVTLTVNPLPTLTVSPSSPSICIGSNITFTASGASTYSWTPPTTLSCSVCASPVANPTATTNYTVTGTNSNGCVNTKAITLTVNPLPTLTVSPSSPSICYGTSQTFTASGASTYSWTPNTSLTCSVCASPTANPTATTNYTVTGTNSNGCVNTKAVTLTVSPLPTVNSPDTIYGSLTATLTASGATTYSWTPSSGLSATTGSTVIASPTVTTIYTVIGTLGTCTASATSTVVDLNLYFRSTQTGNWSSNSTWQSSPDNTTWSAATSTPNYKSLNITVQTGHKVTIASSVTIDQTVVNGSLIYGNNTGNNLTINDGTGTDLTVNGSFQHNSPDSVVWLGSSTWTLGANDTLQISSNTIGNGWRTNYAGGISTIPASSNWILNKTGTMNPSLYSNAGMYYPNLTIQNTTGGLWTTATSSSFVGSATPPIIQGNLFIGGSGGVSFLSSNTNASHVMVQGGFTLASGSTFHNQGTGFDIQGNVSLSGADSTTSSSVIRLTGNNTQTLSGTNLNFRNLEIHKISLAATVSLTSTCTIRGLLQLDTGVIVSDTVHLLTFNAGSTTSGVNDSSFVSGPVKKIGNTAFTFPLGKHTNSQTIGISAPTNSTDAFQAEYFDTNPTSIYGVYTDTTFNYVSTCQYFKLLRKTGTSNIIPTLGWDLTSCVSNLLPAPRIIGYNGTKWKDLGESNLTYAPSGGTISAASAVTQYGAFTIGNSNPLITNTPNGDTCFAAIIMPDSTTSLLNGQTQSTGHKWYTFTPKTPEIKITLTNTNMSSNHIHDIMLFEGACYVYQGVGHDSAWRDTTLTITLHEAQVGTPYFIETFRQRNNCSLCSASSANFNIKVQSLPTPVQTVTNSVVYLNGHPSHMAEQVVIRINKAYLNATNVNNTSLVSGTASQFFDTVVINSIANLLYNNNVGTVNGLTVKKVYPKMTFADTITLSRDSQLVRQSALFETFILSLPKNTRLFWTSRMLTFANKVMYSDPNLVMTLTGAPDDPYYALNQDNLHDGTGTYPNGNINAEGAWNIETGKSFINIGVYDTGIDQTHVELSGKVIDGWNYTGSGIGSSLISGTCDDGYIGHGTACAGIIGAIRNNTIGFAGIAGGNDSIGNLGCSLYDMKIFDSQGTPASSTNLARAIQEGATAYGLHVMNNSYANFSGVYDRVLHDAVEAAAQSGVIFVASRGNYYGSGTTCYGGPSNYNVGDVTYPACFADYMVINVGASGWDGESKSPLNGNSGDACDNDLISMSGENIDVIAPGTSVIVSKTTASSCSGLGYGSSDYASFGGTSSAAAHVSGAAGLILSQANSGAVAPDNLAIEDVEWLLQKSANNRYSGAGHYDSDNGWGIINAGTALNNIENGTFKIQHFAMNDSKGTTWNGGKGNSPYSVNQTITLTQPYDTLNATSYNGDVWQWNIELHYTLDDPNDVVWAAWPRFSASSGFSWVEPLPTDNWCQLVNFTNHEANLITYQYDIKRDASGPIDPLYPANIYVGISIYTYNSTTGINKYESDNTILSVYPNPTQEKATVGLKLTKAEKISLEIFDMQGTLIKTIAKEKLQEGNHEFHISVSDIAQGVYQIKLSTETLSSTKKLIVVR
jgi:hypothetical protein